MANSEVVSYFVQRSLQSAKVIMEGKASDAQGRRLLSRFAFIKLKSIVDGFHQGKRENRWVIMPGLRGTGKSTLMAQTYLHLVNDLRVEPVDVLYLSLDEAVRQLNCNLDEIVQAYESYLGERLEKTARKKYFLIDEAHFDPKWAVTLKVIYEKAPNAFILVTGSSALALQSGPFISADVARRAQMERLDPLRFTEYAMLKHNVMPVPELGKTLADLIYGSQSAQEVYDGLVRHQREIASYWTRFGDLEIQNYLDNGSFPFTLGLSREDSYPRIVRMIDEVVTKDLALTDRFRLETLQKFPRLILMLASYEDAATQTLATQLPANQATLIEMLDALKDSELITSVPSFGSVNVILNKPPRYTFTATSIKAAFLWSVGKFVGASAEYGKLLEEAAVQYFRRAQYTKRLVNIGRRTDAGEADFVLSCADGKRIACEVGYGSKNTTQVLKTMESVSCKYGILISDDLLRVDQNVVTIPKQTFLML